MFVDGLAFGGPAEQLGIDWDWEVVEIEQAADRPPPKKRAVLHSRTLACGLDLSAANATQGAVRAGRMRLKTVRPLTSC